MKNDAMNKAIHDLFKEVYSSNLIYNKNPLLSLVQCNHLNTTVHTIMDSKIRWCSHCKEIFYDKKPGNLYLY
jgi:hypothetical protein